MICHMAIYILYPQRAFNGTCENIATTFFVNSVVRSFVLLIFLPPPPWRGPRPLGGYGRSAATAARRGPDAAAAAAAKIEKENFGFSRKSWIFAKILDFCENLGFWRKSRIFTKILDFCENFGFLRKSCIFEKILDFFNNLGFSQKISMDLKFISPLNFSRS